MTPCLFAASLWHVVFGILMCVTAVFLMLIVLVQRGRGGGLAGAFGGAGGQSAFGTKAGDLFTRITIAVAAFWISLCVAALWVMGTPSSRFGAPATDEPTISTPDGVGGDEQPAPDGASPAGAEPTGDAGDSS